MSSFDLEIILSRQLAECLNTAMFITDPAGNLLFYNEPAELILGRRFEDTGPMPVDVWATVFTPLGVDGEPLIPEDLPLVQTLSSHKPAHGTFFIRSLTTEMHQITVTSFPLNGRDNRYLGAIALFWAS